MEMPLLVIAFIAVAVGLFAAARYVLKRPHLRGASAPGSGLLGAGFDQVWQPQAVEAREIVDAEHRLVVEVPAPDDDLGVSGRIRL